MKDIQEGLSLLEQGQLTSLEWVEQCLQKQKGDQSNALISVSEETLNQAKKSDEKRKNKKPIGRLEGVPLSIKDMICVKGQRTTAGSRILENYVAPYSATLIEKLEAEGAIFVGKTNMDEFGMGSRNENSAFGSVRNPWNSAHCPGGSSGGSAAAVASGLSLASIGTDTGGSIRQPASHCGLVGLKPTYGRVSRFGVIAYASSLEQAGPIARTVKDAALLFDIIAGHDPKDGTSSSEGTQAWSKNIQASVKAKKIGLVRQSFSDEVSSEVKGSIEAVRKEIEAAGGQVEEVDLKEFSALISTYYLIATCEASSNLSRYDGVRYGYQSEGVTRLEDLYVRTRSEGFGREVKKRILLGTFALSHGYYDEYYLSACRMREQLRQKFKDLFSKFDLILSPCAPTVAPKLAPKLEQKNSTQSHASTVQASKGVKKENDLQEYLEDIFTVAANLCGAPAISVPVGISQGSEKLPIGVQLMAPWFKEDTLFDAASFIEKTFEFQKIPEVVQMWGAGQSGVQS